MKNIILLLSLFFVAQYAIGKVIEPSDELLDSDLKFQHSDTKTEADKRKIASDKKDASGDENRDVASEEQKQDAPKVQYWEY